MKAALEEADEKKVAVEAAPKETEEVRQQAAAAASAGSHHSGDIIHGHSPSHHALFPLRTLSLVEDLDRKAADAEANAAAASPAGAIVNASASAIASATEATTFDSLSDDTLEYLVTMDASMAAALSAVSHRTHTAVSRPLQAYKQAFQAYKQAFQAFRNSRRSRLEQLTQDWKTLNALANEMWDSRCAAASDQRQNSAAAWLHVFGSANRN